MSPSWPGRSIGLSGSKMAVRDVRIHAKAPASRWSVAGLTAASLWMTAAGCGAPAAAPDSPASDRQGQLYVAAGQSNMVGFGAFAAARHRATHPSITYQYPSDLGSGIQSPRQVPLFFRHGSLRQGLTSFRDRGVGPWWAFAHELAKQSGEAEVRILMLAVNGSSLDDWARQDGLLDKAIPLIREATSNGETLCGLIWHHGESGVGNADGDYGEMLRGLVSRIRNEAGVPQLPFVAAMLPKTSPHAAEVNGAISALAASVPACAVANIGELTMSDGVHLDVDASEKLGVAMADAMMRLQAGAQHPPSQ